ncbi:MAG TPA: YeeE/YedE thiosulfate transporter family protein [Bacteroidota bacterium]
MIGLYVPALYLLLNKHFGISSTFRDICAACVKPKADYFHYNWKDNRWRLLFVAGIVVGGFLSHATMTTPAESQISTHTLKELSLLGIRDFSTMIPQDLFSWKSLASMQGFILIVVGGFLVGFGTRYAEGCTSGHSIHGIATFQQASIVATICFFIGGLFTTHILLPHILHP